MLTYASSLTDTAESRRDVHILAALNQDKPDKQNAHHNMYRYDCSYQICLSSRG